MKAVIALVFLVALASATCFGDDKNRDPESVIFHTLIFYNKFY